MGGGAEASNHASESKDRHEDHREDRCERAQSQSRSTQHRIAYRPNRRTALGQTHLTRQARALGERLGVQNAACAGC